MCCDHVLISNRLCSVYQNDQNHPSVFLSLGSLVSNNVSRLYIIYVWYRVEHLRLIPILELQSLELVSETQIQTVCECVYWSGVMNAHAGFMVVARRVRRCWR